MLHINKVKRILRAKNGSQIPKFQNPAGPFQLSDFWTNPTLNTQTPSIFGNNLSNSFASNYSNALYNPTTLGSQIATHKLNSIDVSGKLDNAVKSFASRFDADAETERIKQQIQNNSLSGKVGNFISKNQALLGMGLDYANNQLFGDLKQSSGMDTVTNMLNYAGIGGKATSFGMNALDSLGEKNFNFQLNTEFASDAGASYQNLINDALRLQSKSGNYGLSSRSKLNKAKQEKAKISEGIAKATDILNTAKDQKQAGSNDLNYLKYNSIINGNNYFTKSAKQGGKLIDKISLIKSRNLVKQYINSDTLQIEEFAKGGTLDWEPTIDIFEPVIEIPEFQKGGQIEENWEPTIEILNDLPEYKSGGKTRTLEELIEYAKQQNPRFIQRLSEDPKGIEFTDDNGNIGIGNVFLEWSTDNKGNAIIYPRIQEMEDKNLKFLSGNEAYERAIENKNFLMMSPKEADIFFAPDNEYGTAYKRGWPNMFKSSIWKHEQGGKTKSTLETPEIEETTQKNIIPEGALHKNKHHIEHTEGLTKKGIPVVDNDGNQQAEVEKEEIIFSLEVTKKLEELYKDYYNSDKSQKEKDEAAIEAGKLLVYQILFNTDDRTGLIKRCEEGGKL